MRHALGLSLAASILAVALPASALVYEPNNVTYPPNGLLVPVDSSPEIQLYTLFQNRGETLDWHNDAHTTPNAFSPLCGFTATYVLNQAGSHFGLAWYNETGTAPTAAQLHVLVAANSPVGTMFTGTAIQSDPAYTGGTVGFALVGGETHYTNSAYSTVCTDTSVCNPAAPWITALIYASTATPNAYYVAFEDGATASNGWNNDGDFNDDVYFITGISCEGGGQPCDTGLQGICASGLTQCSATGTTCDQLNQPTAEVCNGLDDDCNGMVDDNAPCPTGEVCDMGSCVPACGAVAPCKSGEVCESGRCIEAACVGVTCPSGEVCSAGTCKGPCDDITCPYPDVCRVGACVDPCAGVTCGANQVCTAGVCVVSCTCQPCATGSSCNATSGQCVPSACAAVTCDAGSYCATGACVDDCSGAVCPSGQACQGGACVPIPDAGVDAGKPDSGAGDASTAFDASTHDATVADAHADAHADAGPTTSKDAGHGKDAGKDAGSGPGVDAGGASGSTGSTGGCGCRVSGDRSRGTPAVWGLGLLGVALVGRRARRRVDRD